MKWWGVMYANSGRTFAVSEHHREALDAYMLAHGHPVELNPNNLGPLENPRVIDEWAIDFGGFWTRGTPLEQLFVNGLVISIDCDRVPSAIETINKARPMFGEAYAITHWCHGTILSLDQRNELLRQLEARREVSAKRAEIFHHEYMRRTKVGR